LLVIALLYGDESDWLRNVRAGGCRIVRGGRTYVVGPPELVETNDATEVLERLSHFGRRYCRLAEKVAVFELGEQLPGFGRGRS
jgi:hypothetical protein